MTKDYGETWTSISGNLPNEPVNVVREDPWNPGLLFAGTDFAVYEPGRRQSWPKMKANMPTVAVHDLQIHPRESDLIVATHGRCVWIADISALEEMTPEVLAKDVHLFGIEPGYQWSEILPRETFSTPFSGKSEPAGITFNYYLKKKPAGEVTIQIHQGAVKINEIKGSAEAGLNSILLAHDPRAGGRDGSWPDVSGRVTQMNLEDIPEEYRGAVSPDAKRPAGRGGRL